MQRSHPLLREYLPLGLLIAVIWFLLWGGGSFHFLHSPLPNWRSGDLPAELAGYKAFVNGDLIPFLPRFIGQLNAPFTANWNDFIAQDMTYVMPGLFAVCFGFFEGLNLAILALHILCGLSFYGVGRALNYQRVYCLAGALIFAFSAVIFFRGLGHTTISTMWHIPLMLFTLIWITSPEKVALSEKNAWRWCYLTCILAALFSAYYGALFVLLLGFIWLIKLSIGDRSSQKIALLIWLILLVEFVQRSNYFYFRFTEGINTEVLVRALATLASVSLTLPDLIFSPAHSIFISENFLHFSHDYYQNIPDFLKSESQLAYIGLVPAFGLCYLIYQTSVLILTKRANQISTWFWLALGVFVFSITGGLNYLMGSFGFLLLRSNNRFSVFLLLIALYYLCEVQSKKPVSVRTWIVAVLVVLFAIWDQVPTSHSQVNYLGQGSISAPAAVRQFTETLEAKLPPKAMVFQLPVHVFPEGGSSEIMGDYDHFLPYLFSQSLHFSYGSMKGREDTVWQARVTQLPLKQMTAKLESYGFSALLINRNAYPDHAVALIADMNALGYQAIDDVGNLIAFALHPDPHPISPAPDWEIHYGGSFLQPELMEHVVSHANTSKQAILEVKRPWYIAHSPNAQYSISPNVSLQIAADSSCQIQIVSKDQTSQVIQLVPQKTAEIMLTPNPTGTTQFQLNSDCATAQPSALSTAPVTFRLLEPQIR